jgi:hypothetical protein
MILLMYFHNFYIVFYLVELLELNNLIHRFIIYFVIDLIATFKIIDVYLVMKVLVLIFGSLFILLFRVSFVNNGI